MGDQSDELAAPHPETDVVREYADSSSLSAAAIGCLLALDNEDSTVVTEKLGEFVERPWT